MWSKFVLLLISSLLFAVVQSETANCGCENIVQLIEMQNQKLASVENDVLRILENMEHKREEERRMELINKIVTALEMGDFNKVDKKLLKLDGNFFEYQTIIDEVDNFDLVLSYANQTPRIKFKCNIYVASWFKIESEQYHTLFALCGFYKTCYNQTINAAGNATIESKIKAIYESELPQKIINGAAAALKTEILGKHFNKYRTHTIVKEVTEVSEEFFDLANQKVIDEIYDEMNVEELVEKTCNWEAYPFPYNVFSLVHIYSKTKMNVNGEIKYAIGVLVNYSRDERNRNKNFSKLANEKLRKLTGIAAKLMFEGNLCFRNIFTRRFLSGDTCQSSPGSVYVSKRESVLNITAATSEFPSFMIENSGCQLKMTDKYDEQERRVVEFQRILTPDSESFGWQFDWDDEIIFIFDSAKTSTLCVDGDQNLSVHAVTGIHRSGKCSWSMHRC